MTDQTPNRKMPDKDSIDRAIAWFDIPNPCEPAKTIIALLECASAILSAPGATERAKGKELAEHILHPRANVGSVLRTLAWDYLKLAANPADNSQNQPEMRDNGIYVSSVKGDAPKSETPPQSDIAAGGISEKTLRDIFMAGFDASAEGYNGECHPWAEGEAWDNLEKRFIKACRRAVEGEKS